MLFSPASCCIFGMQISPRQGLLRVREFTLAEIEHFVDPEDKTHPKFVDVSNLEFLMFPRKEQMAGESAKPMILGEAISKVCWSPLLHFFPTYTSIVLSTMRPFVFEKISNFFLH